mgnify:CR=1 FL=1
MVNKQVLAVDDSKTMREMVSFTLRNAGYSVVEADDGKSAIDTLAEHNDIDLIITDLNMPGMDGFSVVEHARSHPSHKFVPILILTTESDVAKKERGKAAGATGWIVKPFNPEKLVQVVGKVCPL